MRQEKQIRVPELDGIRGLAIALVVFWHYVCVGVVAPPGTAGAYALTPFRLAWSGVDCFFVLSGFLIGGILLDARGSPTYFRTFYLRRFCRILPLYLVILGLFGLAVWSGAFAGKVLVEDPCPAWSYLSFTQNLWVAFTGHATANGISHSWSLAIEEQFYLTLPLLIWLLPRRGLVVVLALLVVLAPVLRIVVAPRFEEGASHLSFCRMDSLCLGVLGAVLVRSPKAWDGVRRRPRLLTAALALTALGMALVLYGKPAWLFRNNYTLIAAFYFCLLLTAVAGDGPVARLFRSRFLQRLGVLCYGLYLLHVPLLMLCHLAIDRGTTYPRIPDLPSALASLCALVLTFVLAEISWRFFEKPFVRLGHRVSYWPVASPVARPPVALSIAQPSATNA